MADPTNATVFRLLSVLPASLYSSVAGDPAIGVGVADTSITTAAKSGPWFRAASRNAPSSVRIALSPKLAVSNGQLVSGDPIDSVSPVWRAEARSRGNDRPDGVAHTFQVRLNKVEPSEPVVGSNLFAKANARSALADEVEGRRPQVPLVSKPLSFACRAERLTGAGASPDGSRFVPSGELQGVIPHPDSGEEVYSSTSSKVIWRDIFNGPLIHVSRRDQTRAHQLAQPSGGVRVDFVVKRLRHVAIIGTAASLSIVAYGIRR